MNTLVTVAALAVAAGSAAAAIDGTDFANQYGPAIWTQNVGTQFGNNANPDPRAADGSEIDALYTRISGGKLLVGVAGNLSTDFNKLNLLVDFRTGGQNQLNGLGSLGNLNGLTLDAGFDADLILSYTAGGAGNTGSGNFEHYLDAANIGGFDGFAGGGELAFNEPLVANIDGAEVIVDSNNANTGGVANLGESFTSDPGSVTTGVEFSIDIAALGWNYGDEIRIAGWINGASNDFLSNQVIGGFTDSNQGNLGGDGAGNFTGNVGGVNFQNFDGDQFVSFIPAPGAAALFGFAGLAAARRRR